MSQSDPIKMAFALYCCDSSGLQAEQTPASPVLNRKWSSWGAVGDVDVNVINMIDVTVRNGRFLVHLGETERGQVAINDIAFDVRPLYVVTWVAQPIEAGGYRIYRLPPQKLDTVPHAVTAQRADGFEVLGILKVDTINSRTANSSIEVTSDLQLNSDLTVQTVKSPNLPDGLLTFDTADIPHPVSAV